MTKKIRKVVKIDEEKCNGCGNCIIACAEGALKIIDGKARLIGETYCDGLGACLGECPQGAITVEERIAEEFSETEVEKLRQESASASCGCPGASVQEFASSNETSEEKGNNPQVLTHWPVQLALVPPSAPFLRNASILLTGDCVPFAYPGFHQDFIRGHVVLVACPKLDDFGAHLARLSEILKAAKPKSITIAHMEVPCCSGLVVMAKQAMKDSGIFIPLDEITVNVKGEIKNRSKIGTQDRLS